MNISERNKKVAINRWDAKLKKEKNTIKNTTQSMLQRASICGFLAGDGSVQIRKEKTFYHYQLDFFPDDKKMLDTYTEQMIKIYNKKPSIKEKKNYFTVRITSKNIITDLLKYARFGLKTWNIPEELFKIKNAEKYWLKAFFSAEGTVDKKRIKIQSINNEGIRQVSKLLQKHHIEHKLYEYQPKNTKHNRVYVLMIFKKEARKIYLKEIGFWHSKKEKILKESLDL